jgi:hypothetical protein
MHVTVKTKSESSRVERTEPKNPSVSGDGGLANGFEATNLPVNSTSALLERPSMTVTCGRPHRQPELRRIVASALRRFRAEHDSYFASKSTHRLISVHDELKNLELSLPITKYVPCSRISFPSYSEGFAMRSQYLTFGGSGIGHVTAPTWQTIVSSNEMKMGLRTIVMFELRRCRFSCLHEADRSLPQLHPAVGQRQSSRCTDRDVLHLRVDAPDAALLRE